MRLLAASLLLVLPVPQEAPPGLAELPPRRPVAGMHGFHAVSTLTYVARPDLLHRLEVHYQFPARARWSLTSEPTSDDGSGHPLQTEGSGNRRVLEYRLGTRGFQVLPGRARSVELAPADAQALAGRTELRRVAMLWPDGLDWEPRERSPDVRTGRCEGPLGPLVFEARLEADGRPRSFVLLADGERESERLEVTGWSAVDGRTWPAGFVLHAGETPVWRETLERVSGNAYFLDLLFLPSDRRPARPGTERAEETLVRAVDLVPCLYRRHALAEPRPWEEGLRLARRLARETTAELEQALDPRPTLEVDEAGRVTAVVLRLADAEAAAPEGWSRAVERPGLLTRLRSATALARHVRALRQGLPPGATAGVPYVRVYADGAGAGWLEVALPLGPAAPGD